MELYALCGHALHNEHKTENASCIFKSKFTEILGENAGEYCQIASASDNIFEMSFKTNSRGNDTP